MDLCFDTAGTDEEQPSPVKPHMRRQNSNGKNVDTGIAGETPKEVWTISPRGSPVLDQAQQAHHHVAAAAAVASMATAASASGPVSPPEGMGLFLKLGSARDEEPGAAETMDQHNPAKRRRMESSHSDVRDSEGSALRWSVTSGMRGDTPMPRPTHATAAGVTGADCQATGETAGPENAQCEQAAVMAERHKHAENLHVQQHHRGDSSAVQTG